MSKNNIKLVAFDVDGVLLRVNKGGFKEVAEFLGKGDAVKEIHKEYERKKNQGPWGLAELAQLYAGFKEKYLLQIANGYVETHLMPGAEKLISWLKKQDIKVIAISSNPHFILDVLAKKLKLDFVKGNELEYVDGVATGKISQEMNRHMKAKVLQNKINEWSIEKSEIAIVGESVTDLPMSELANLFIGFNPSSEIMNKVDFWVKADDLRAVYGFLV